MTIHEDPCEKQRREKYKDHEFSAKDFTEIDSLHVKDLALAVLMAGENNAVRATIDAFLGFLAQRGYKVVKKEKV